MFEIGDEDLLLYAIVGVVAFVASLSAAGFQSTVDDSPFSFADPEHICRTLEAAGFSEIIIQPHDEKVSSGDLDAMTWVLLKVGPLERSFARTPRCWRLPSLHCVRR
jgi:hypothetical protein